MTKYAQHLSRKQFRVILDAHDIPKADRPALAALVYHGKRVGTELHARIDGRWRGSRKNGEYAKCMAAILQALSAPIEHEFPPKDWQPGKSAA